MKRLLVMLFALQATPVHADATFTLALGGDVMFGRMTAAGYVEHPAAELQRFGGPLRQADIALVNLETGICSLGRKTSKFALLWAPPQRLKELDRAGVDVVSIANNHALDCGPRGVEQTIGHLEHAGIGYVGRRSDGPLRVSESLVVIAATMHPPPYRAVGSNVQSVDRDELLAQVSEARRVSDAAIVVSLHWGKERSKDVGQWQRTLARELIDEGATVIAGHGPHTEQDVERHAHGLIFYSLGNLSFDDSSPIGRPVPPRIVTLARADTWRAQLATAVVDD